MSSKIYDHLIETLADLGGLYPDMRFGQLVEMVALLAGEETPLSPTEVEDDQLLSAAADHLRTRRQQLRAEERSEPDGSPPELRAELLQLLERARDHRPAGRFGQLVAQLATTAGSRLYDAEDEQLVAAARHLIGQPG